MARSRDECASIKEFKGEQGSHFLWYAVKTLFVNKTVPTMISETQGKYTTARGLK